VGNRVSKRLGASVVAPGLARTVPIGEVVNLVVGATSAQMHSDADERGRSLVGHCPQTGAISRVQE
jgi:hypothetical protein